MYPCDVDPRDFSGTKSVASLFWRGFAYARRHGDLGEFFAIYEPVAVFAPLVAEAKRRLQVEQAEARARLVELEMVE